MATLEQLFAGRNLTKLVQGIKPGLPRRIPDEFFRVTDQPRGHVFEWFEFNGNRDMALIVSQDSPAHRVGHPDAIAKSATMLRTFESQQFLANKLRNLIDPTTNEARRDEMGRQFVTRSSEWFKRRQENLVQTAAQVMLFDFAIHFNEKGELLTSSSGATVSIDPAIPAGQINQLDILGSGDIIDTTWATDSTDIIGDLAKIKDQMLQLGGWNITEAFYGGNIAEYIASNDAAKEYINRTPALATQRFLEANKVPTGFQNLNWHDAHDAFYIDASGSVQTILGDDEIVFTPPPSEEWWKYVQGTEMVPSGLGVVGSDASELLGDLIEVQGNFSYATMVTNPVSIEQFSGLNWLPLIVATRAVCRGDVTP